MGLLGEGKNDYEITATVTIQVKFMRSANSEEEALKAGREEITDEFHLFSSGGIVDTSEIKDLEAEEITWAKDE